jgi:hypothetical protein
MARYTNGINGTFQGKVGKVVGATWRGIPYMRSLPEKRTSPPTKKEKINREKWALSQLWLQPVLDFVREGFKGFSATSQGFVAAKSYLLKNAIEVINAKIAINPALVKVSFGTLPLPENITANKIAKDIIQFTWDNTITGKEAHPSDQVMLLAYDIEHGEANYKTTGQLRSTGSDTLQVVAGTKKRTFHLYAAFVAYDRSRQSDSIYLGQIKI